jgi:hypothetical protein
MALASDPRLLEAVLYREILDRGQILSSDRLRMFALMNERWPHYVHYRGGRVRYCPPDRFGMFDAYPVNAHTH